MIEAIEKHETQITDSVKVILQRPVITGMYFGIGLILAPAFLYIIFIFITLLTAAIVTN